MLLNLFLLVLLFFSGVRKRANRRYSDTCSQITEFLTILHVGLGKKNLTQHMSSLIHNLLKFMDCIYFKIKLQSSQLVK